KLPVGIHPTAVLESEVPASTAIGAHVFIGRDVVLGEGCRIYPNVTIYPGVTIGNRAILHSGCVIGADGFGFAPDFKADGSGAWVKIPQIGGVSIGDDVEIGANTSVDRGALDDTVIGNGVKIDNQVQIAHNCVIGDKSVIAGCVGIAGSAKIGHHVAIGGAAMILGHLEIPPHSEISPGTFVMHSLKESGKYTGIQPAQKHADWVKNAAHARHLADLAMKVATLEKQLAQLESMQNG
ncbi:MAG: UDP-3-O-(3-hydroxymyristoyl)glucosamine N-acyltransferase, partial [Zoogloeaceae bacterium]|nr:UDP-3-O-(3-hydroxymyristoyl)glucosamine N-acyltransferase [Zoogloeaceae bacterium]